MLRSWQSYVRFESALQEGPILPFHVSAVASIETPFAFCTGGHVKITNAIIYPNLRPPSRQAVEQWYRVQYPGGIRLRASPSFEHTDPSLGVLVCGWVFLATRRYRAPGSSQMFLQVSDWRSCRQLTTALH